MERLTKEGKFCDVIECELTPGGSFCERGTCTERRLWERLSSIEDILGDDYDLDRLYVLVNQRISLREEVAERWRITGKIQLDRLRELVQADRDGRCVVLPAKIGDTIYHITTCKNFPQVLDGTMYDDDGGYGTATGLYCPCELMENCPFPCGDDGVFDCDKHKNTLAIFKDIVDSIHIEDMEDYINFNYSGCADFEDFGKTVFLTRKAAEEALKERGN